MQTVLWFVAKMLWCYIFGNDVSLSLSLSASSKVVLVVGTLSSLSPLSLSHATKTDGLRRRREGGREKQNGQEKEWFFLLLLLLAQFVEQRASERQNFFLGLGGRCGEWEKAKRRTATKVIRGTRSNFPNSQAISQIFVKKFFFEGWP